MAQGRQLPTPEVLRNRGVPVDLLPDDEGQQRPTFWVRFTANTVADLEERYDGLEGLEAALETRMASTVRTVLAMVWAEQQNLPQPDERGMGALMDPTLLEMYASAVGAALALATGVDPTQAHQLLQVGVDMSAQVAVERNKAMAEMLAEARKAAEGDDAEDVASGSHGPSGGAAGSPLVTTPTSSGG